MKGSRLPTAVNAAATLAMLGLIALFGFQAALAPPPTVAALQPPTRELKNAPPEQSTVELPGQSVPSPSPAPGGSQTAQSPSAAADATRQCYALTQTPDPQSPPCRQGWDPTKQNNGGATAPGVTGDTIYVAYPCLDGFFERCPDTTNLEKFFNTHFEFWGRKIELVDPWCTTWRQANCNTPPPGSDAQVKDLQADASKAAHANDAKGGIFASLSYYPANGVEHYYYDTLAAQYRVVSVSSVPNAEPESHYAAYHPFEWAVTPTADLTEENLGQFLCRTMAGRAPTWAQATNQWQVPAKRTFGIVWTQNKDGSNPVLSPLTNALQSCGASMRVAQYDPNNGTSAAQVVTDFMTHGVSTVGCVCGNPADKLTFANTADNQGFHPEWLVWPFGFQDVDSMYYQYTDALCACTAAQWPKDQQNSLIGFSDFNKILPPDEEFWFQAMREANPNYQYGDNGDDVYDYYRYEELMVLATGIQMAGPHLTPQTFAAALQSYPARDPGHGAPPYYQALVGFTAGHGWIQDYAAVYWNQNAQNYFTNEPRTGSLCYIADGGSGLGVRFGLNQWPSRQLDFYPGGNTPCR
jgi:hypothetical protein